MEKRFDEKTYVICHNGSDVIHPVRVEAGTVLTSGQPQVEEFADEGAWKARLTELGYNSEKLAMLEGPVKGPSGLLTPEERKALTPEERKALRAERLAAHKVAQSK